MVRGTSSDIDIDLLQILQNHHELASLIEAWPDISPELRAAIFRMIAR